MKTIHAVYDHGIFQPSEPVGLPEPCEVEFEPRPVLRAYERRADSPVAFPEAEAVVNALIGRARTVQERHTLLKHFIEENQRTVQAWIESFQRSET